MIRETVTGSVAVIALPPGRLDGGELDDALKEVVSRQVRNHRHHLFLDLVQIKVITQRGLFTLMNLDAQCRRSGYAWGNGGGGLHLCRPSKAIRVFLEYGKKYHNFSIHATITAARKARVSAE